MPSKIFQNNIFLPNDDKPDQFANYFNDKIITIMNTTTIIVLIRVFLFYHSLMAQPLLLRLNIQNDPGIGQGMRMLTRRDMQCMGECWLKTPFNSIIFLYIHFKA